MDNSSNPNENFIDHSLSKLIHVLIDDAERARRILYMENPFPQNWNSAYNNGRLVLDSFNVRKTAEAVQLKTQKSSLYQSNRYFKAYRPLEHILSSQSALRRRLGTSIEFTAEMKAIMWCLNLKPDIKPEEIELFGFDWNINNLNYDLTSEEEIMRSLGFRPADAKKSHWQWRDIIRL